MNIRHVVAIDLGASSGRVMLASYDVTNQKLSLDEIHRFTNHLIMEDNHCYWDLDDLESQILVGLHHIAQSGITIDSIGIDTWGVDFVLLDHEGNRIGRSYSYRDHRTQGVMEQVQSELGIQSIYQKTGIQFLPFNTLYQLKALQQSNPQILEQAQHLLLIPDYLSYRLTGKINHEYTNSSTSQLVNLQTGRWDEDLINYLQLPSHLFGEIKQPGNTIGFWKTPQGHNVPVIAVASHDTASAVIAAPLINDNSAYLSSGTWSLMGFERSTPCICDNAFSANITNEGGINGYYRVLKNIMGLWLFQRICLEHNVQDIDNLIQSVEAITPFTYLINPNDPRFLNPESMSLAIKDACQENQQPIPNTIAELTRCVFDSLALLYRQVFLELQHINKSPLQKLHVVGGGSQNALLNQLCANTCGIPVSAGPIEASTLGNIGYQLIALNDIPDVSTLRKIIAKNTALRWFKPQNLSLDAPWKRFKTITD
ncbi:rhamnulokinase [Providencia heimbachae]|uniref:Rhamnulokinase n=1 Tax=Providencia heimbachae ATCC 35613 TaxID=1354272 RepID=A0A1B7K0V3_9GAMM|nr:rhamnulokinase [Providencia heimbachae]OAT53624.1 rhamnulokinase [Providencia heimbachae ATCC 35613]SQH13926.1 Rhamnulokinase [Providencia heimbachae]